MQSRIGALAGFVLAGGASTRMGQPKPRLVLGHQTMVERQVRLLQSVCHPVAVLGPQDTFGDVSAPVFADELPGRGPLGALYTGLLRTRREFNLFLSCDLPLMEPRFLRYLSRCALESETDVTVPCTPQHGYQPLSAVYRRRALPAVRTSLERGENKVSRFFHRVSCRVLEWQEIARAGFRTRTFFNMNTPDDYLAAKRVLEGPQIAE